MQIENMLQRLKISSRVYLGFGVVLLLLLLVGISAYFRLGEILGEFINFGQASTETLSTVEIDRNAVELDRNVQLYMYTGHKSVAARVRASSGRLLQQLKEERKRLKDEKTLDLLNRMEMHLIGYQKNFEEVVLERQIRSELVQMKMMTLGEKTVQSLNQMIESFKEEDAKWAFQLSHALDRFLLGKNAALQFFEQPESRRVKVAKERFSQSIEILNKIQKNFSGSELGKRSLLAQKLIDEYESSFLRAVQATRGYLYLVNVVMAGESSEFSYYSERIRKLTLDRLGEIEKETISDTKTYQRISSVLSVVAVLVGLVCSWLIAVSIVSPVSAMTKTFNQLAKGDSFAHVPGTEREDEIGEMAKAADIFKEKNHQTEILLKESQRLSGELTEKQKELERSNGELEQFVYTVSHDLKSPLVTSMGFIGMIRDLAENGHMEQAIKKLEKLEKSNQRMSDLIYDILNLSRIGKVDIEYSNVDMNSLIRDVCTNLSSLLKKRRLSLKIQKKLPHLIANESRMIQTFDNLINNAIKYSGKSQDPKIEIGAKEKEDSVLYFVKDNGIGIDPRFHEKIFGLFQRLENKGIEGTGVGLSIVSKIMKSHEGKVWVESEVGKGSCFWLEFPKTPKGVATTL